MTAALPPEISSNIIYAGPGAWSLVEASVAWTGLADGLQEFAASYTSTITSLDGIWMGPSAAAMTVNAHGYAAWAETLAAYASQMGMSAMAAADAFNIVHATVTPPAAVAANRAQLAMLVATNFLGQNFPAIAATEAQYMEMWAANIAALLGYQTSSAAATSQLAPPGTAPAAANPAAVLTPIATGLGDIVNFFGTIFNPFSFLGATLQSTIQSGFFFQAPLALLTDLFSGQAANQAAAALPETPIFLPPYPGWPNPPMIIPPNAAAIGGFGQPFLTARMGAGNQLGPLTVPPNWKLLSSQQPIASADGHAAPFGAVGMPMGSSFAGAGGTPDRKQRPQPEYGLKPKFVPRPPVGG